MIEHSNSSLRFVKSCFRSPMRGSAVIGFSCCGVPALIFCLHIYSVFILFFFFCILRGKANKINKKEDRLKALSLLFIHQDVALDYDVIIDDYAKSNKRRMTFINPLQWIFLWLVLESCPWDAFPLLNFFYYKFSLNLCSKPTFLVANDQRSRNACSKYPSQTNWIWQFSGRQCCWLCWEVVLPPQSRRPPLAS